MRIVDGIQAFVPGVGDRLEEILEQTASVLEQRLASPQLDGFHIGETLFGPLVTDQRWAHDFRPTRGFFAPAPG